MADRIESIQTERLVLRGIDESDTEAIVEWRSDPKVYRYFTNPRAITPEMHLEWYRNRYLADPDRYDWMALEKETGKRIGVFGLRREGDRAEVSYLLAPDARHRGFAGEAVRKMTEYAFTEWKSRAVTAVIHRENTPSAQLAGRLGFIPAGQEGDCFDRYVLEGDHSENAGR